MSGAVFSSTFRTDVIVSSNSISRLVLFYSISLSSLSTHTQAVVLALEESTESCSARIVDLLKHLSLSTVISADQMKQVCHRTV